MIPECNRLKTLKMTSLAQTADDRPLFTTEFRISSINVACGRKKSLLI
jgi:hypothetical protein